MSEYPNRYTMTNHPMNSVLVARLLAAVGEFCFGMQLALGMYVLCARISAVGLGTLLTWAISIVVLDGAGQCCATYGTIAGSSLPFFVEGVAWTVIMSTTSLIALVSIFSAAEAHAAETQLLWVVMAVTLPGSLYMACGYCPLCWKSWQKERDMKESSKLSSRAHVPLCQESDLSNMTFASKCWEALTLRVPTQEWSVWKHEVVWQTLYFSVGTWSSLAFLALRLDW